MTNPRSVDILWTLDQLVNGLKPFASAREIGLRFDVEENEMVIDYLPQDLLTGLVILIVKMISLTRPGHSIQIKAKLSSCDGRPRLQVNLENKGISDSDFHKIENDCAGFLPDVRFGANGFEWLLPVNEHADQKNLNEDLKAQSTIFSLPVFYKEVRKHLQFHFSRPEKLMDLLSRQNARAAAYLNEVNQFILSNISDPLFDANKLSRLMHLSRIQLYRKLKPLIKQSPADYIRSLRLQKAKELLETTDLRVSEVAFQTGFQSHSHFTHVFIQNFGARPSLFSRKSRGVTNE
ncbi:MAG: helix-turn-helix domain-containing protein [Chitinophagales bacterium]